MRQFYTVLIAFIWLTTVLSKPAMRTIVINNHQWKVPNEPGWEEVIEEVQLMQQRILNACSTIPECAKIPVEMRRILLSHPVSKKYLEKDNNAKKIIRSIFGWY